MLSDFHEVVYYIFNLFKLYSSNTLEQDNTTPIHDAALTRIYRYDDYKLQNTRKTCPYQYYQQQVI